MGFEWIPGEGVCEHRLTNMRRDSPMPLKPMGEAWFIGENRRIFTELLGKLDSLPVNLLQEVLEEIGGGISSFGCLEEWDEWFGYLLPRLIPRSNERYVSWLLEELCTAFLQIDLGDKYRQPTAIYRDNVLHTLGRTIMDENKWKDGSIILGQVLHPSNNNPAKIWGWSDVSGDLAASMIVCLRLIEINEISGWVKSIFAIECPYWRAQVLTWYIGAKPMLDGKVYFPSQFDDWTPPDIGWSWSHCISGMHGDQRVAKSLVADDKMAQFKAEFEFALRGADLESWKMGVLAVDALRSEIGPFIERTTFS